MIRISLSVLLMLIVAVSCCQGATYTIWQEDFNTDPFTSNRWYRTWHNGTQDYIAWNTAGYISNGTYYQQSATYNSTFSTAGYTDVTVRVKYRTGGASTSRYISVWMYKSGVLTEIGRCPSMAWDGGVWRTYDVTVPVDADVVSQTVRLRFNDPNFVAKDIDHVWVTGVPEPSGLLALASGFVGLAGVAIRRKGK